MIRDKEQLIKWLVEHTKDDIVLRTALRTGQVELLREFDPLPSSHRRGWLIKITTTHAHVYYVAVPMNQFGEPVFWYEVQYALTRWNHANLRTTEAELPRGFNRIPRSSPVHPGANWSPCVPPICTPVDEKRGTSTPVPPALSVDDK